MSVVDGLGIDVFETSCPRGGALFVKEPLKVEELRVATWLLLNGWLIQIEHARALWLILARLWSLRTHCEGPFMLG